jgi:hypothetical protein
VAREAGPGSAGSTDWAREVAKADGQLRADTKAAQEELRRRKEQFAGAAAELMMRLRRHFEAAATAFNAAAESFPVAVNQLKGSGFVVSRANRKLTVLKSADWNVVFTFSDPPKVDLFALLSRLDGEGVRWSLYRKHQDEDRLEAAPTEAGDLAETTARRLFVRLVQASGPRAARVRR